MLSTRQDMKCIKMNAGYAKAICAWQYEAPYEHYNMTDAYDDLLASYTAVVEKDHVIGFYCTGEDAQVAGGHYDDQAIDIGLGLSPQLCGIGKGENFIKVCLDNIGSHLPIRLSVLETNKRAIKVYEKLGFTVVDEFKNGQRIFLIMLKS